MTQRSRDEGDLKPAGRRGGGFPERGEEELGTNRDRARASLTAHSAGGGDSPCLLVEDRAWSVWSVCGHIVCVVTG